PRGAGGAPGGGGGGVSPRPRLLPRRPGGHGRRDVGDARARAGPAALRGDQSDRGPGCADRARRPPAPHPRDSGGQREGSRERPARPALASAVIGRIFSGKYEVTGYLSEGGMALVYRGRRLSDNREVAIKVLREQYAHDKDFVARFEREAQAVARLSHPRMVQLYDSGRDENVHFIVMEFVQGEDLKKLLRRAVPPRSPSSRRQG